MNGEPVDEAMEAFLGELRSILQHLYDPSELRRTPLLTLLGVQDRGNPVLALRQLLISAIQALEPRADVPIHSTAWRIYHILTYRYVEQSDQRTVASNLGLSVRQLRRQERLAEQALADYLWSRYDLQHKTDSSSVGLSLSENSETLGREQELEWVRQSFPSEVTDVPATLDAALRTIDPLVQVLGVQVVCDVPASLPLTRVTGQRVLLRQALLSLLTAAVHAVAGGVVRVAVKAQEEGIVIRVEATLDRARSLVADGGDADHLQMARECIELFGGTLELETTGEREQCYAVTLLLPTTERVPVLAIDDNVDTLRLFGRYLAGTRYRFVGVHDPREVIGVAESVAPRIIILDVMLPEIDGWELLGRLREHPTTRATPIIICTIMPQEQLALALGAAGYLRKPISREVLLSTLDRQTSLPWRGSH